MISVLNREGTEVAFVASCANFSTYVEKLGAEDAVVMEVGMGSFWWADQIESRGGELLRHRSVSVSHYQGLVEQDRQA